MVFLRRVRKGWLLFALVPLLSYGLFSVQETEEWIHYAEQNQEGKAVHHHLRFSETEIELISDLPDSQEHQLFKLKPSGETDTWQYSDSLRNSTLTARLSDDRSIHLTGQHKGKKIDKRFEINDQPWNQPFHQGLAPFFKGDEKKTVFWAIGTRGKGELKITRFAVSREPSGNPPQSVINNGYTPPFLHIKISLSGLLAIFWSGHYWYDAQTGRFLYYKGKSSYLPGDVTLIKKK